MVDKDRHDVSCCAQVLEEDLSVVCVDGPILLNSRPMVRSKSTPSLSPNALHMDESRGFAHVPSVDSHSPDGAGMPPRTCHRRGSYLPLARTHPPPVVRTLDALRGFCIYTLPAPACTSAVAAPANAGLGVSSQLWRRDLSSRFRAR